jgi:hypothetical protein
MNPSNDLGFLFVKVLQKIINLIIFGHIITFVIQLKLRQDG